MVTPVVSTPSAGVVYVFNRVARVRAAAQVLHACATSNAHPCCVPPLASVIDGRGLELGLHDPTMTANIAMQLFRSFRVFGNRLDCYNHIRAPNFWICSLLCQRLFFAVHVSVNVLL